MTIPPSWFDPAEAPAQITPLVSSMRSMMLWCVRCQERIAPALATSWTESPDGLTYEFKLRQGLRFHNGDACSAEDVQYSFTRYKGAGAKELQAKVQQVEVVDPLTIRFHLREPWPDFMTFYGTTATAAGLVVPKNTWKWSARTGSRNSPLASDHTSS